MNREEVVRLSTLVMNNNISIVDANNILTDYCLEHNKDPEKIAIFIEFLFRNGLLNSIFIEVLEYYERKFNIVKLQSKPNHFNQRTVLQIS
jgi:hypothetical protein